MELEWEGTTYPVPSVEPPQERRLESLHPLFRDALVRYIAFAQAYTPHELRAGECRRSTERQIYLLSLGRVLPGPVRSWTLQSKHLLGLACDLVLVDRVTGQAVWDKAAWGSLYTGAPPEWFSLKTLTREFVHVELAAADAVIARGSELSVIQT